MTKTCGSLASYSKHMGYTHIPFTVDNTSLLSLQIHSDTDSGPFDWKATPGFILMNPQLNLYDDPTTVTNSMGTVIYNNFAKIHHYLECSNTKCEQISCGSS